MYSYIIAKPSLDAIRWRRVIGIEALHNPRAYVYLFWRIALKLNESQIKGKRSLKY